jgi:hypothetical protein
MARSEDIPLSLQNAAHRAGLNSVPLWYAGGLESRRTPRKKTFEDLVQDAKEKMLAESVEVTPVTETDEPDATMESDQQL